MAGDIEVSNDKEVCTHVLHRELFELGLSYRSHMFNRIRRALRAFDVFSLSTLNPSDSAYTTQMGHAFSQTRIF